MRGAASLRRDAGQLLAGPVAAEHGEPEAIGQRPGQRSLAGARQPADQHELDRPGLQVSQRHPGQLPGLSRCLPVTAACRKQATLARTKARYAT